MSGVGLVFQDDDKTYLKFVCQNQHNIVAGLSQLMCGNTLQGSVLLPAMHILLGGLSVLIHIYHKHLLFCWLRLTVYCNVRLETLHQFWILALQTLQVSKQVSLKECPFSLADHFSSNWRDY